MSRTALYRHYSDEGRLLYVGISNSPIYRLRQHEAAAPWFFDIASIKIEWLDNLDAAKAAEVAAIASEQPLHNSNHNASGDIGGFVSAVGRAELCRALDLKSSSISRAITENKMPCNWARMVAKICRERSLYVPVDAFPFCGVTVDRRNIAEMFSEDARAAA